MCVRWLQTKFAKSQSFPDSNGIGTGTRARDTHVYVAWLMIRIFSCAMHAELGKEKVKKGVRTMVVLVVLCAALLLDPAKIKTTAIETMALGSELSVASQGGGLSPNFCTPLTNNDGIVYTTYVGIGSPPQHISVVPDTGSYVLAVTSTNCGDDACRAHNRFAPEKSSTDIKVESNVF